MLPVMMYVNNTETICTFSYDFLFKPPF